PTPETEDAVQRAGATERAADHLALAVLDAAGDLHLAVTREQGDGGHLPHVHADRVDVPRRVAVDRDDGRPLADVVLAASLLRRLRGLVLLRVERPEHGDHAIETLCGELTRRLRRPLRCLVRAHIWKPSPFVCACARAVETQPDLSCAFCPSAPATAAGRRGPPFRRRAPR